MSKCDKCARLPEGIEGHIDLFTYSMGGNRMQFKCGTCGCMWTRQYAGDGGFEWAESKGKPQGMDMPGRRTPK